MSEREKVLAAIDELVRLAESDAVREYLEHLREETETCNSQ